MEEAKFEGHWNIKLLPLDWKTFEWVKVGDAGAFKVDHPNNAAIGYSEVSIHFEAGAQHGTLELIRAERGDLKAGRMIADIVIEDGDEGQGPKLLLRRYKFSAWGIEEGRLVFFNCRRY